MNKKKDPNSKKSDESTLAEDLSSAPQSEPLPAGFEETARQRFEKLTKPEISFDQYLIQQKIEFQRQRAIANNPPLAYKPTIGTITPCGNGDFEQALDPAEWQGAYGLLPGFYGLPSTSPINLGNFTSGIVSGGITDGWSNTLPLAHQSWVAAGSDPYVGIPTTAPAPGCSGPSFGAVRIGNAVNGYGCELLSKTFVVTPAVSIIKFWYAVVLQNPGNPFPTHPPSDQPFFWVRVTDASGNIIPGAFDFGSGSDKVVADSANPFFKKITGADGQLIVYKDWSCAQIDLSTHVGKQVTIEFVTGDCEQGGHWGYAYIDRFCGDCECSPTGNITYNCEASTHCGTGQICFDYSLPTTTDSSGSPITGSVTITLGIYQNGALLTQLSSPKLTSGSSYCFNITPASIPGINAALGGFDFVATGAFEITANNTTINLGHILVGAPPEGITPGKNNDYQIACKTCEEIERDQNAYLSKECAHKVNFLSPTSCDCPDSSAKTKGGCHCDCVSVKLPDIKPCIAVAWGDSPCDCLETDDVEVLCVTVCNCYSNVTFNDLTIGHIQITDMAGNPVANLPDGTPSVQIFPSGPICFGDIGPCKGRNQPSCVSRELVLYTRGAIGKDYKLSFEGVCFTVSHHFQSEECFVVKLCQD